MALGSQPSTLAIFGASSALTQNAVLDLASELIAVKSLSEVVELTTADERKQFEALVEQGKG